MLAVRPCVEERALDLRTVKSRSSVGGGKATATPTAPPAEPSRHPQISVTDELGELVLPAPASPWNAYAQLSGKQDGVLHELHDENGTTLTKRLHHHHHHHHHHRPLFYPELHKSSSGSIEVQLSVNCSQLTVPEIFALIQQLVHQKACGLVSRQDEHAAALLLGRPDDDIHIAVEVSPPTGPEGLKGLKIRRISGDYLRYDRICNDLIASINI